MIMANSATNSNLREADSPDLSGASQERAPPKPADWEQAEESEEMSEGHPCTLPGAQW